MAGFLTSIDICNRALQIIGAARITSFTDGSKEAAETFAVYDKLRQAELRRNAWRFAIKRVALRALDDDSMFITPPAYSAGNTYALGYLVTYGSVIWQSQRATNIAHTPGTDAYWEVYSGPMTVSLFDTTNGTEYFSGELAYNVTAPAYLSAASGNVVTPPTSAWITQTSATLSGVTSTILYPLGAGPVSQSATRNIFVLPNGYLRKAPQYPNSTEVGISGGPNSNWGDDWVLEGNYLISSTVYPLILRFIADITLVTAMDPMFCEGLAGRIGYETCQTITQSDTKRAAAREHYLSSIGQARLTNGIEVGEDQPPEDEYITVRS